MKQIKGSLIIHQAQKTKTSKAFTMWNFLKNLFGSKNNSEVFSDDELIAAGACPNCWGHHAYDGEFVQAQKDSTKSNINHNKREQKAFVAQFIEDRVTGIRLKKDGDHQICPACSGKYKLTSDHAT